MKKKSLLNRRETEIAELVSKGHNGKEIAKRTGLTYWTVTRYLSDIYEKLGLNRSGNSRVKLATYWKRNKG